MDIDVFSTINALYGEGLSIEKIAKLSGGRPTLIRKILEKGSEAVKNPKSIRFTEKGAYRKYLKDYSLHEIDDKHYFLRKGDAFAYRQNITYLDNPEETFGRDKPYYRTIKTRFMPFKKSDFKKRVEAVDDEFDEKFHHYEGAEVSIIYQGPVQVQISNKRKTQREIKIIKEKEEREKREGGKNHAYFRHRNGKRKK